MTGLRRFVAARAVTWAGNAVTLVALPLLVYRQSESALISGAAFAVESLPYLLFGLIAGAMADRVDRRAVLIASQAASAAALASIPIAGAMGVVSVPHVLVVAFAVSTLFVFYDAAAFGVVPALVGRDGIASATATLVSVGTVIGIAGPLIGGLAATALSPSGAIAIDAACYLVACAITATIVVPSVGPVESGAVSLRLQVVEGLRYIRGQSVVFALTMVGTGVSLANGIVVGLMVVMGIERLGMRFDDARLGFLYAATALGAFLVSLVSARIQRVVPTGRITLVGLVIAGAAMVGWVAAGSLLAAVVALVAYQAANTLIVVNGIVVRQSVTPDRLQSRVNTTARMIAMGGTPFGAAIGGAVAEFAGLDAAVAVGVASLAVSGVVGVRLGVHRLPVLSRVASGAHGEGQ